MIPLGLVAAATPRATPGGGGDPDPLWDDVVALLNMPGVDGSTTFVDATGRHTWTAAGDAQVDNSLGYNACLLDGFGDYVYAASSADFSPGTGNFTVEAWIRPTAGSLTGNRVIYAVGASGGVSFGLTGGKIFCGPNSVSFGVTGATVLSADTLVHVEASKHSGTMRIFVNGVQDASGSDSRNYGQSVASFGAGSTNGGSSYINPVGGYIKALRITKGVARHTTSTSFTPPAAPFPDF